MFGLFLVSLVWYCNIDVNHCTYRDWPPMTDVQDGVEEDADEETRESRDLEWDEDVVDRE